ncbi:terminase gpA endonuclease subunit, partial [Acinetobacter baumannii]|uniref:terminase gpA endonuclease subunit n=1 Tax=Acinetobacter baumannii TaxID=470 RepID=UPI00189C19E3
QQVVIGCDGVDSLDQPVKIVTQAEPVPSMPGKKTNVGALKIAQVGVSFLKSEFMGALSIPRPEDSDVAPHGWVNMPLQGGAFGKELAKQLVAERKVIVRDKNDRITQIRWDRIEGRRAEGLDCHNYARAGASLFGWDRMTDR